MGLQTVSPTFWTQYAVVAPVYPLPIITMSVSVGKSLVERKSRSRDFACSIQNDLVAFEVGRTMAKRGDIGGELRFCEIDANVCLNNTSHDPWRDSV